MHRQRGNFSIGHFKDKSSGGKSSAWWQTHLTLAKPTGGSAREAEVTEHENTHKLSHLKVILHMIRYHFSYNAYMHLSNGIVLRGSFMSICLASSLGLGGGQKETDSLFNIHRPIFSFLLPVCSLTSPYFRHQG